MVTFVTLDDLDVIGAAVAAGAPVILPTDTVYGLAASPLVPGATDALFALKGRDQAVPLAVLCASADEAWSLVDRPSAAARALGAEHWPGPLTLVLRRRPGLDWALGEPADTIGVRCPDDAPLQALLARTGPLATTSANRHAAPTPATAREAADALVGDVAVVVDGGPLVGRSSTVVDATGDDLVVLRPGPVVVGGAGRPPGPSTSPSGGS